jgi:hypothetical protein
VNYAHAALDDALMATKRLMAIFECSMFTVSDFHLYYDTIGSRFEFDYRGVNAYAGSALTAGEYVFAMRWGSDKGELGLANWYVDLFVNGVKGTGGAGTARTEDNATKYCYYGAFGISYEILLLRSLRHNDRLQSDQWLDFSDRLDADCLDGC